MLSKCANPTCGALFRFLHEGRLFMLERPTTRLMGKPAAAIERYWLCSRCAREMTLLYESDAVVLRPLGRLPPMALTPRLRTAA